MTQKKTNKTQVSDTTKLKQQIRELRAEVKSLRQQVKRSENQRKEMQKVIDSTEQFIRDCTDHLTLDEALQVARNGKDKRRGLSKRDKLIKELQDEFGRKK